MNPEYMRTFLANASVWSQENYSIEAIEKAIQNQKSPAQQMMVIMDSLRQAHMLDIDTDVKPKSVLETSEIGKNLHSLLEQADHPLTETALAYIKELEGKLKEQDRVIDSYVDELRDMHKENISLNDTLRRMRAQVHHPARRR